MCKLLVVFFIVVVFVGVFFQKAKTFDDMFYNDYLFDLDRLIRSYDQIVSESSNNKKVKFYNISKCDRYSLTNSGNFSTTSTPTTSITDQDDQNDWYAAGDDKIELNAFDYEDEFEWNTIDYHDKTKWSENCIGNDPRLNQPIVDDKGSTIMNVCYPNRSRLSSYVSDKSSRFEIYSGFFPFYQYDKMINSSNHFWLFMTESNYTHDPLIVFLHATPHTSLLAHFLSPNNSILGTLNYNFLFIEYKTRFGYSFTQPVNETDHFKPIAKAVQVHLILRDFFTIFPEFLNVDLYLAGSYEAGKVAEMLLFVMDLEYSKIRNAPKLKGAIITHGAVDIDSMLNFGPIWLPNGIIDLNDAQFMDNQESLGQAVRNSQEYKQLEYFVSNFLQGKVSQLKYTNEYEEEVSKFMEKTTLKIFNDQHFKKLHNIGDRNYTRTVSFFGPTTIQETDLKFKRILDKYKILYCNGQLDNIYTYSMTTEYLKRMQWPCNDRWYQTSRQLWYEDGDLIGYWQNYSNLHQVLLRNIGYSVDLTRPKVYLKMIDMFIQHHNSTENCYYA